MSYIFGQEQIKVSDLTNGDKEVFGNKVMNITQLGIQGPPGLKFLIEPSVNSKISSTESVIILNETGIIDIDLEKTTCRIYGLKLPQQTIATNIETILIDYINYDEGS